jgi:hypothetical protein
MMRELDSVTVTKPCSYPEDDRFLIERDLRVRHYEVVA